MDETKKICRSEKNKIIGGVCGGIAEYLNTDPTIIRLAWILFTLISTGIGIILYGIALIIMPQNQKQPNN